MNKLEESNKKFYNIDRNGLYSGSPFFFELQDYCLENDIWLEWKEGKDKQGNWHLTKFKIELDDEQKKELLNVFPDLKDELRRERIKEDVSLALPKDSVKDKEEKTKSNTIKTKGDKFREFPNRKKLTTPYYIDEQGFKVYVPRVENGRVILTRDMMDKTDLEDWEEDW